jgi:hypothetical protein
LIGLLREEHKFHGAGPDRLPRIVSAWSLEMDITRYHVFLVGTVLLLLGLELRLIDSFVLTSKATKYLAEQTGHPVAAASEALGSLTGSETPLPAKTIHPPEWSGWFLISLGSVLILQSCAMPKPS